MVAAKRRVVAGIVGALMGLLVPAGMAVAQGPGEYAPVIGACIRKIINLPGLDIPDQPIDVMIGGQIDCPPRGG